MISDARATPEAAPVGPSVGRRAVAVFVIAFVALQIVVPSVQLAKPRPSHFGWQMFSGYRPIPRYWLMRADGSAHDVAIEEHIPVRRLDAEVHPVFPAYLLKKHPDAVAVRWQWPESTEVQEWRP